jgi:hypothetical protein
MGAGQGGGEALRFMQSTTQEQPRSSGRVDANTLGILRVNEDLIKKIVF